MEPQKPWCYEKQFPRHRLGVDLPVSCAKDTVFKLTCVVHTPACKLQLRYNAAEKAYELNDLSSAHLRRVVAKESYLHLLPQDVLNFLQQNFLPINGSGENMSARQYVQGVQIWRWST